ncbi:hypothetical protein ANN_19229 [Periplaneta americana]|uniref:Uncharacterized protein n=1 Tax=Periplaneta americana TaxID=6978 RepID=A0ABQ8S9V1_PERAM|nr:hypothetical protein ANN_19229 [Periplaneta americana]
MGRTLATRSRNSLAHVDLQPFRVVANTHSSMDRHFRTIYPPTSRFCDASERAYGAVIYVRSTKDDCVSVSLACSKNRLAPVKKVTLPRLELQAALVGA